MNTIFHRTSGASHSTKGITCVAIAALGIALTFLIGCADLQTPSPPTAATSTLTAPAILPSPVGVTRPPTSTLAPIVTGTPRNPPWHIRLEQSGGIAGLRRTLDLSDNGSLVATDQKVGKQVTARLEDQALMSITTLIPQAPPTSASSRRVGCADCFEYHGEIQRAGQTFAFQLDDTTLAGSDYEPLVRALVQLIGRALSGQLGP